MSVEKQQEEIFPVDENDTDVMVTITLDDGSDLDCEILTIFTLNDQDYIVLLPVDEFGEPLEEQAYIYRYLEDTDGTPHLDNIKTDEEYARATSFFNSLLPEDS